MVRDHLLLMVVHTIRDIDENGETIEIIRVISARSATPKERRRYEYEAR
ncbi:MAG: hypothetical protein PW843_20380 [Azospirillaceae bacterium]|nr:hypothetical protein [Azospirillaceae bacterium]